MQQIDEDPSILTDGRRPAASGAGAQVKNDRPTGLIWIAGKRAVSTVIKRMGDRSNVPANVFTRLVEGGRR